jgi:hypothetical protein
MIINSTSYEITETVAYTVDDRQFTTKLAAQEHQLLLQHYDNILDNDRFWLRDLMEQNPEHLITQLQAYVAAKKALRAPAVLITEENFSHAQAYVNGNALPNRPCVNNINDMRTTARSLISSGQRFNAIKFVRRCFTEAPSLLECKNYVEALLQSS